MPQTNLQETDVLPVITPNNPTLQHNCGHCVRQQKEVLGFWWVLVSVRHREAKPGHRSFLSGREQPEPRRRFMALEKPTPLKHPFTFSFDIFKIKVVSFEFEAQPSSEFFFFFKSISTLVSPTEGWLFYRTDLFPSEPALFHLSDQIFAFLAAS